MKVISARIAGDNLFLSIFTPYKMFAGYLHLGIKRTEIPRNGDFAIDPNVVPLYKI